MEQHFVVFIRFAVGDGAEGSEIIEIALDQAFQQRPVNTTIHEPYLIARLMEHPARVENTLEYQVHLQDVGSPGTRLAAVKLTWTDAMIPATPLAAQREYITESAAYGLALRLSLGVLLPCWSTQRIAMTGSITFFPKTANRAGLRSVEPKRKSGRQCETVISRRFGSCWRTRCNGAAMLPLWGLCAVRSFFRIMQEGEMDSHEKNTGNGRNDFGIAGAEIELAD